MCIWVPPVERDLFAAIDQHWQARPLDNDYDSARTSSDHLLMNRTSRAISCALLSKDGVAVVLDYGYDVSAGIASNPYRSARRPWLASLPSLHRDYGVDRIEVVMPTHYHDDHVTGFNLLREVEGAEVWAGSNVADVISRPTRYDLPCLWYDPIPVDRVVPLGQPVRWREDELTLYELGGHTFYAVAISFAFAAEKACAGGGEVHLPPYAG